MIIHAECEFYWGEKVVVGFFFFFLIWHPSKSLKCS